MTPFNVPEIFSTWAGLGALSGAIERKLWHRTDRGCLYSGIYVLMVGPAASGKTLPIVEARRLLERVPNRNIAPSNITRAAFVDELNDAKRSVVRVNEVPSAVHFNALSIMLDEFGVFLHAYEPDFLAALTAMWDGNAFVERKRKLTDKIVLPNVSLTLIAGCTPGFLNNLIPEDAWEQGFMSRTTIVYSGTSEPQDIWKGVPGQTDKFEALAADLRSIGDMYGQMEYEPRAIEAIRQWHLAGGPPAPIHPSLKGYTNRRTAHLIKLCILISASESASCVITLDHYQQALAIMGMTERMMGDVFLGMKKGGDTKVMEQAWFFAYTEYNRYNRPVPARDLITFVSERTPSHNIPKILDTMVSTGSLERKPDTGAGVLYIPRPPKAL